MIRRLCLTILLFLAVIPAAQAHKLKVFATAEGPEISGYAYFVPGGRAPGIAVTVTQGDTVRHLNANDQGEFSFPVGAGGDTLIQVDGGDGHYAEYVVRADEITPPAPSAAPAVPSSVSSSSSAAPAASTVVAPPADIAVLRAAIEESVARQVRPLREQLDTYQEKVWMHDVLGGLGVIFGLGGVAFGFSRRRSGS